MRHPIPEHFQLKSNWMPLYYLLHGLTIWLGCGFASYYLYTQYAEQTYLVYPLIALCSVVSGLGLFFIATLGHEGFHGCMNSNRTVSMVLGILFSSLVPFFVSTGYTVLHWQHHQHTNTEKDPDYALYSRLNTFFSRLLIGPTTIMLLAYSRAFNLIFSPARNGDIRYPFAPRKARLFAILNILLTLAVTTLYGVLFYYDFTAALFMIGLPFAVVTTYFAMAPYIEHSGTTLALESNTRTYTSRFFSIVLLGYNFHAEHHHYPSVQSHKLIALHAYLKRNGLIAPEAVVEDSFLRVIKVGATGRLDFTGR
ncbi:fatty acid desaturase family protein [Pseudomonas fontis]|uniref:Fatty acid desaturase n=1 Tax=Pseudomonas fontis TaxID=2942633 RepID=A0ABT5NRI1_9PSED|nr:fatty acid desaturase [Pseudomonas fontis]MDD0976657.1 fatty acid desaturase [Pseudomonas fontis]MDD0990769.1 fatty acid desaturase [Pseudomonas fontis]